jgi:hypothetical protein
MPSSMVAWICEACGKSQQQRMAIHVDDSRLRQEEQSARAESGRIASQQLPHDMTPPRGSHWEEARQVP